MNTNKTHQMDIENLGDIEIVMPNGDDLKDFDTQDPEIDQNCPTLVKDIVLIERSFIQFLSSIYD